MTPLETDREWMAYANCLGLEALMFPSTSDTDEEGSCVQAQINAAKAVCARCSVQPECLDYALTHRERFGVWGGTSERERRSMITGLLESERLSA